MTLLSRPPDARIALRGSSEVIGVSPLDLGPQWIGRYSVTVQAPGYAVAQGTLYFPERGGMPYALSEPGRVTGKLLLHSIYFPGVPALMSHRRERGLAFLTAGVGGLGAVVRDHLEYHSNRDKTDFESQDRSADFRYARDRWAIYTGVVWAASALDHITRARMDLIESTPMRVTVGTSKLSRTGVVARSLLIPGAGQDCIGQNVRGSLWLGATLLAGAAYLTADESHHRIETKLARAELLLSQAGSSDVPTRQADVDHFTDLQTKSRRLVNRLALTTLVIYAANVIDAGLAPLETGSTPAKLSFTPSVGPRAAEIALTRRF
jgi:uncharacterized protein DUF5683